MLGYYITFYTIMLWGQDWAGACWYKYINPVSRPSWPLPRSGNHWTISNKSKGAVGWWLMVWIHQTYFALQGGITAGAVGRTQHRTGIRHSHCRCYQGSKQIVAQGRILTDNVVTHHGTQSLTQTTTVNSTPPTMTWHTRYEI